MENLNIILSELEKSVAILADIQLQNIEDSHKIPTKEFAKYYIIQFTKMYLENLRLVIKMHKSEVFIKEEEIAVSRHILRKCFDIVAKLLYISQKEKNEREIFIVHQLLNEVYFFTSHEHTDDPAWEQGDKLYKTRLSELMGNLPDDFPTKGLGLSKEYLKKHEQAYPNIQQILEGYTPKYTSSHILTSLTGKELYYQYATLSEYLHARTLSNVAASYRSITAVSLEFFIPTRMMLELLDTYFHDRINQFRILAWIKRIVTQLNLKRS